MTYQMIQTKVSLQALISPTHLVNYVATSPSHENHLQPNLTMPNLMFPHASLEQVKYNRAFLPAMLCHSVPSVLIRVTSRSTRPLLVTSGLPICSQIATDKPSLTSFADIARLHDMEPLPFLRVFQLIRHA